MISGLVILVLTLISLFLLWKNHSESKQFSLDKLELENKIVKLNQELNKSTSQCTKLEDQVKTIQVEVPIEVEFKYPTIFGNERAKKQRDLLINRTKDSGYNLTRSFATWTDSEDAALQHRYKIENKSVQELSRLHERTVKAISSRLKILNLI